MLRIRDGRGTLLTVSAGVLWITEERSPVDTVLLPGDTWRIGNDGTTLAQAHRSARVVLEVPSGLLAPRRVEMAPAEGERGLPIALGRPGPYSPGAPAAAMVAAIGKVIAAVRALWTRH